MKWPWVSRTTLDAAVEHRQEWSRIAADWSNRYDELLRQYQQLKLQGFTEPVPIMIPSKETPDPIRQAIIAASRGDPQLRRIMEEGVARDRAAGVDEGKILVGLYRGQQVTFDD